MFKSKISTCSSMFEDALYRNTHENITDIDVNRDLDTDMVRIVFTIENIKKTKTICSIQYVKNGRFKHHRLKNITFQANKFASLMDEVPDYISDEQIGRWLELRMDKL